MHYRGFKRDRRGGLPRSFLTDGGLRTAPGVRDAESLRALTSLGIAAGDIRFAGSAIGIADGSLHLRLQEALQEARSWIEERGITPGEILAPDWEGGHPDHDACHAVAMALAKRFQSDGWGFSLYNAFRAPSKFFRVLNALPTVEQRSIRYSLLSGVRNATFCFRYRSQRRTWLGLFPESLVRRTLQRKESVNAFDPRRLLTRPHEGQLLYERMFGRTYEEISRAVTQFATENALY